MRINILSLVLVAFTAILVASKSDAADFYQWTDRDGVVNFTDDALQIPAAYKAKAVERDFADLSVDRLTPENTSGDVAALEARLERLRTTNAPVPAPVRECEGHVTVTSDRIQVGEYNQRVFIVTNECGETVSVTPFYPDVQINR